MSKFSDQLRLIGVFNNWELLKRFGDKNDVVIDYRRKPPGRMGICEYNNSSVWSPHKNKALPPKELSLVDHYEKKFPGNRSESMPEAVKWASQTLGHEFVSSPFGGMVPKPVREKAKAAINAAKRKARMSA